MTILKIQNPPVTYTQTIYATLWIAGAQRVGVDIHGVRGPGSHIAVAAEQVLIYLHDLNAARTYADAWIDAVLLAKQLPAAADQPGEVPDPDHNRLECVVVDVVDLIVAVSANHQRRPGVLLNDRAEHGPPAAVFPDQRREGRCLYSDARHTDGADHQDQIRGALRRCTTRPNWN